MRPSACSAVGRIVNSGTYARGGSETANRHAAATSSGISIWARISASGTCGRFSRIGVSTTPGATVVKRTPLSSSNAAARASACRPALDAW